MIDKLITIPDHRIGDILIHLHIIQFVSMEEMIYFSNINTNNYDKLRFVFYKILSTMANSSLIRYAEYTIHRPISHNYLPITTMGKKIK